MVPNPVIAARLQTIAILLLMALAGEIAVELVRSLFILSIHVESFIDPGLCLDSGLWQTASPSKSPKVRLRFYDLVISRIIMRAIALGACILSGEPQEWVL